MRSRDFRRHQKKKLMDRWTRIGHRWGIGQWPWDDNTFDKHAFDRWLYRSAENMPTCSKPHCCGNPRRLGYKSWREKKAEEDEIEQRRDFVGP